jgi:hypothetical protein
VIRTLFTPFRGVFEAVSGRFAADPAASTDGQVGFTPIVWRSSGRPKIAGADLHGNEKSAAMECGPWRRRRVVCDASNPPGGSTTDPSRPRGRLQTQKE